jgi:hypothetical protein
MMVKRMYITLPHSGPLPKERETKFPLSNNHCDRIRKTLEQLLPHPSGEGRGEGNCKLER